MTGMPLERTGGTAQGGSTSIELIVSSVLRYGVLISLALVAAGVILLFATGNTGYGNGLDLQALLRYDGANDATWPHTIGGVVSDALALRPYALILLGLLFLIATPVLRVVVCVFTYLLERDYLYVAITLFVLGVLALSFFLGATH